VYIDDYAHHPTELNVTIQAARMLYPEKSITGIFQPHLFSRTRDFAKEFAVALDLLDQVILLDIYPARELPIPGITAQTLADLMQNTNVRVLSKADTLEWLTQHPAQVLLTMGAGDIDSLIEPIKGILTNG
jgi:UDP-N-acetylmuramate--alanine ligase